MIPTPSWPLPLWWALQEVLHPVGVEDGRRPVLDEVARDSPLSLAEALCGAHLRGASVSRGVAALAVAGVARGTTERLVGQLRDVGELLDFAHHLPRLSKFGRRCIRRWLEANLDQAGVAAYARPRDRHRYSLRDLVRLTHPEIGRDVGLGWLLGRETREVPASPAQLVARVGRDAGAWDAVYERLDLPHLLLGLRWRLADQRPLPQGLALRLDEVARTAVPDPVSLLRAARRQRYSAWGDRLVDLAGDASIRMWRSLPGDRVLWVLDRRGLAERAFFEEALALASGGPGMASGITQPRVVLVDDRVESHLVEGGSGGGLRWTLRNLTPRGGSCLNTPPGREQVLREIRLSGDTAPDCVVTALSRATLDELGAGGIGALGRGLLGHPWRDLYTVWVLLVPEGATVRGFVPSARCRLVRGTARMAGYVPSCVPMESELSRVRQEGRRSLWT